MVYMHEHGACGYNHDNHKSYIYLPITQLKLRNTGKNSLTSSQQLLLYFGKTRLQKSYIFYKYMNIISWCIWAAE